MRLPRHPPAVVDLSSAATGRLVGVAATAVALLLFALVDLVGLSGTARAVAVLVLAGGVAVAAMVGLGAWLVARQSEPLTDRPEEWEIEEP